LLAIAFMVAIGTVSCGGGGNSGGGGGGGSGGGGSPQTVNVSVVAQATNTTSDTNNQKTLGPIVLTLP